MCPPPLCKKPSASFLHPLAGSSKVPEQGQSEALLRRQWAPPSGSLVNCRFLPNSGQVSNGLTLVPGGLKPKPLNCIPHNLASSSLELLRRQGLSPDSIYLQQHNLLSFQVLLRAFFLLSPSLPGQGAREWPCPCKLFIHFPTSAFLEKLQQKFQAFLFFLRPTCSAHG